MTNQSLVILNHGAAQALELSGALTPAGYSATTSTMVDKGTSVSGKVLGSVVRHDVVQIALNWNYLSAENWANIVGMFQTNYALSVRFFDQTRNAWDTRNMYISDRGAGMYRQTGTEIGWSGCSLTLTEV